MSACKARRRWRYAGATLCEHSCISVLITYFYLQLQRELVRSHKDIDRLKDTIHDLETVCC
jgi:hypothetical protein